MVWRFIGVYIRTLHGRLETRDFFSHVEKYFTSKRVEKYRTSSLRSLEHNTRRENWYLRAAM